MKDGTMVKYYSIYFFYIVVVAALVMFSIILGFLAATLFLGIFGGLVAGKEGITLVQDGANAIIHFIPKLYLGWASLLISFFLVKYKLKAIYERTLKND